MKPGGHLQLNPPIMFTQRNWQLCCLVAHSSKSKATRTCVSTDLTELSYLYGPSLWHPRAHGDTRWSWAGQELTWTSLRNNTHKILA